MIYICFEVRAYSCTLFASKYVHRRLGLLGVRVIVVLRVCAGLYILSPGVRATIVLVMLICATLHYTACKLDLIHPGECARSTDRPGVHATIVLVILKSTHGRTCLLEGCALLVGYLDICARTYLCSEVRVYLPSRYASPIRRRVFCRSS